MVLMAGCSEKKIQPADKEAGKTAAKTNGDKTMQTAEAAKAVVKKVKLETSMGNIVVELDDKMAPVTVKNFLTYVQEGFYDGTIFHRVIRGFMIQGGGFTEDLREKQTHSPIVNEAKNGLRNLKGTISMARTNAPDSATSQFFINHVDNSSLNYVAGGNPGYTVFGKVVEGMEVVDKIASVRTKRDPMSEALPVEPVVIRSAKIVSGG
jgi:cyclophilin family peptidyl-prolyl cis-trans isomerase